MLSGLDDKEGKRNSNVIRSTLFSLTLKLV